MRSRVESILEAARTAGVDCEVYGELLTGLRIEVYRGKVESLEYRDEEGVGIRVVEGKKVGFAYTSDTSVGALKDAFSRARSALSFASPLDVEVLVDQSLVSQRRSSGSSALYRALPSDFDIEMKEAGVLKMEQACYDTDPAITNTEGALYEEAVADVFVAGTNLDYMEERRGFCSVSLSAVASKGGDVKSGWYYSQAQSPDHLDFEMVGRLAAQRSLELIGARQANTGRYAVLIERLAFATILRFIESILSGEEVAKGSSVLGNKLGERVASEIVTLVDDPHLDGGCLDASFDAEGLETRRNVLIERGLLTRFLNNVYSAKLLGVEPSANAVRGTYRSPPIPGASNMYLLPGERSENEILESMEKGLLITDIMGLHTADSISGDFSFGVVGSYVENGSVQYPVSEITISGNIVDFLEGIVDLGNEIVFLGSYGAPAVLVEGLSIGGE